MKKSLFFGVSLMVALGLGGPLKAEPAPGMIINDTVLSIGDGVFKVKRHARVNVNRVNEYYVYVDYLEISAWDGSVLSRCRNEMKKATKASAGAEWKTQVLSHEPKCHFDAGKLETLASDPNRRIENGALVSGRHQLATEDFLRERMVKMVQGERNACEKSPEKGVLAGCNLVAADEPLVLDGEPVANENHVLIPVVTGAHGQRDDESAKLWVSIGRKYWR